jgi:hypothetical protein
MLCIFQLPCKWVKSADFLYHRVLRRNTTHKAHLDLMSNTCWRSSHFKFSHRIILFPYCFKSYMV